LLTIHQGCTNISTTTASSNSSSTLISSNMTTNSWRWFGTQDKVPSAPEHMQLWCLSSQLFLSMHTVNITAVPHNGHCKRGFSGAATAWRHMGMGSSSTTTSTSTSTSTSMSTRQPTACQVLLDWQQQQQQKQQ
jgi:hypothetical protein